MPPLLQHRMAPLAPGRYAKLRVYWPNRLRHRLSMFKRPAAIGKLRTSTPARRTALWGAPPSKKRAAIIIAAAPPRVPLQPKRVDIEHNRDEPSWRQNLHGDGWDRQPTEAPADKADQSRFGGVPFEAEQAEPSAQRPGSDASAEISAVLLSTSKAVLGTLDTLKREDYAIGLIAITLGVGAARLTGKAAPALPQLARGSIAAVKGLGNGLTRSQDQAASQARRWLQSLFEDGRKQAAISKESLEEWPELVQASMLRSAEKHKAAIQQLRSNVGQWAEEVQESAPGASAVQSLWKSAAAAARRYQSQISSKSQARLFQAETTQPELSALSLGAMQEPEQASTPAASLAASKQAALETSPAAALEKPRQEALPPAKASPAKALLPAPKEPSPARNPGRSDTQVYAAEAEAAMTKTAAKQAEEAWNERIKGAYAAIAAATPYRPATKKPSSHALSWHRGGNTTLLKPDFQAPKRGANESSPGSGGGSGSAGGSGAGGGSGGGDDSEGSEQPERNPRSWLWAQVLVLAAVAEQGLSWPRRRARFAAALAVLGFLAYAGLEAQKRAAGQNRRKVSRNPFGRFGFRGSRSSLADIAVGELMEFSDEETF